MRALSDSLVCLHSPVSFVGHVGRAFAVLLLGMVTVACSSPASPPRTHARATANESADQSGESTALDEVGSWASYPAKGTYAVHYTRTAGDAAKCPDLQDSQVAIDDLKGKALPVAPNCKVTANSETFTLWSVCQRAADDQTSMETTKTTFQRTGSAPAYGTCHVVTFGAVPTDCTYSFTYQKQ